MRTSKINHARTAACAWALAFLGGALTLLWISLLAAGIRLFRPFLIGFVSLVPILMLIRWLAPWHQPIRLHRGDVVALAIACSTLFFSLPPSEHIMGGWDPGVYIHTAANLQRQGSLQFEHPDLNARSAEERRLLSRQLGNILEPFGGMRILPNGRVSPQFYHAYPVLLAWAMRMGGLWGALMINPLLNVLSLLAFYALVSLWTGRRLWGLAGAALLAINPTQLWQARFCTAEMLTQTLVLAGFICTSLWYKQPTRRLPEAMLAGMAFGMAQLTRYDTLLILVPTVPILLWMTPARRHIQGLALLIGMLGLAAFHTWVHQRWVAPYYRPLGSTVAIGLALGAIVTGIGLGLKSTRYGPVWIARLRKPLLSGASISWILWMLFNTFIRPTLHQNEQIAGTIRDTFAHWNQPDIASTLLGLNSRSMLYLSSIFGMTGLLLALFGAIVVLIKARTPAEHAWAWSGMGVTLLLTWQPFNDLFMMWVSRRYVPIVIPWLTLAMMMAALQLNKYVRSISRGRFNYAGGIVLLLAALWMLPSTRHLARHREWPGLITWFEQVDQYLTSGTPVYTDHAGIAGPLRFIWGHTASELHFARPERRTAFNRLLEEMTHKHGSIYLITANPLPDWESVTAIPIAHVPMRSHKLIQTRTRIPDSTRSRGGDFHLYLLAAETPQ